MFGTIVSYIIHNIYPVTYIVNSEGSNLGLSGSTKETWQDNTGIQFQISNKHVQEWCSKYVPLVNLGNAAHVALHVHLLLVHFLV